MLGRVLPGSALFLMERGGAEDGFSGSKEAGVRTGKVACSGWD